MIGPIKTKLFLSLSIIKKEIIFYFFKNNFWINFIIKCNLFIFLFKNFILF